MASSLLRTTARRHGMLAFVLASFLASGAAAQPLKLQGAQLAAAERSRLAQDFANEISGFLERLGPPSAQERSAVLREVAAVEQLTDQQAVNARMQQLYATPGFHHVRLTNMLVAARDALRCAASEKASVRREMSCWAIAAAYLGEQAQHEEALAVLGKSGRLGHDGGMTRARWLAQAALWARYIHAIHHAITIPFLRASID